MSIRDLLGKELLYFDGAMGTQLQAAGLRPGENTDLWNMTHGDVVTAVHRAYIAAGANILKTNTFGANALKLAGTGHSPVVHWVTYCCHSLFSISFMGPLHSASSYSLPGHGPAPAAFPGRQARAKRPANYSPAPSSFLVPHIDTGDPLADVAGQFVTNCFGPLRRLFEG